MIKNGGGASGAHSDIAHPEVAHAFWSAVLAAPLPPAATLGRRRRAALRHRAGAGAPPAEGRRAARRQRRASRRPVRARRSQCRASRSRSCRAGRSSRRRRRSPTPASIRRDRPNRCRAAMRSAPPRARARPSRRAAAAAAASERCVNVALEDQPRDAILQAGTWYTLAFDVDVDAARRRADDGALRRRIAVPRRRRRDRGHGPARQRRLRHRRPDPAAARAALGQVAQQGALRHLAACTTAPSSITATLHKDGNFLQSIAITFAVGGTRAGAGRDDGARPAGLGREHRCEPRDVGLSLALGDGGYDCIVCRRRRRARAPAAAAGLPRQRDRGARGAS